MATFTLKQGSHYHCPWWRIPGLHWDRKQVQKKVTFEASCAYELPDYNQGDANKLFGLAYGFLGPHRNSVRFGWRWSRSARKVEILAYCYVDGARNWDEQMRFPVVAQVDVGQEYECSITVTGSDYVFRVTQGDVSSGPPVIVPHGGKQVTWGYGLLPYFGGALAAPHTMRIHLD